MRQDARKNLLLNSFYYRGLTIMQIAMCWIRRIGISSAFILALVVPRGTTAQSFEVGGGYSYVRANLPPDGCGCFSLNGGSGWVGIGLTRHFSIVGEVAAQHGSNIAGTGGDLTLTSYLLGPRYTVRRSEGVRPFGQFLVGGAHASGSEAPGTSGLPGSPNAFALAAGGGLDLSLSKHLSLRLVQADYYFTHFSNGINDRQNNFRIGVGLVFNVGKK